MGKGSLICLLASALLVAAGFAADPPHSPLPQLSPAANAYYIEGTARLSQAGAVRWDYSVHYGDRYRHGVPVYAVWGHRRVNGQLLGGSWVADFRDRTHAQAFAKLANEKAAGEPVAVTGFAELPDIYKQEPFKSDPRIQLMQRKRGRWGIASDELQRIGKLSEDAAQAELEALGPATAPAQAETKLPDPD